MRCPAISRMDMTGPPWSLPPPWAIATTVLGFMLWWPLGLLALFLWKGPFVMGCITRRRESRKERRARRAKEAALGTGSGNAAFDDYRAAALRRLEEERQALDAQQQAFAEFLQHLKHAKDREEFDRFMAQRGGPRTV